MQVPVSVELISVNYCEELCGRKKHEFHITLYVPFMYFFQEINYNSSLRDFVTESCC